MAGAFICERKCILCMSSIFRLFRLGASVGMKTADGLVSTIVSWNLCIRFRSSTALL